MKRLIVAILIFCSAPVAFSQDGAIDGAWWARSDKLTRAHYLMGLRDGTLFMAQHAAYSTCRDLIPNGFAQCKAKVEAAVYETFGRYSNGVSLGQLHDGLDALYADSRNRRILISALMPVALQSVGGMPAAEAEMWLELIRPPK